MTNWWRATRRSARWRLGDEPAFLSDRQLTATAARPPRTDGSGDRSGTEKFKKHVVTLHPLATEALIAERSQSDHRKAVPSGESSVEVGTAVDEREMEPVAFLGHDIDVRPVAAAGGKVPADTVEP